MVWVAAHPDAASKMPFLAAVTVASFWHRDRRRRDPDNLLASLKPAYDGIRQAGVLFDDDALYHLPVIRAISKDDPRVEISIAKPGARHFFHIQALHDLLGV